MLHVEQQHTGSVGVIAGVDAGELIGQIVLREHDLRDSPEILRLVFPHPEKLRRGEAGKGNVGRQRGEPVLAHGVVEIIDFLGSSAVVPQDRRTDDAVACVQRDKAVHLPARADARNLAEVKPLHQLGNPACDCVPPVLRALLRPAGVGEQERILSGDRIQNRAILRNKQQLARGCAEINANVIHNFSLRERRGRSLSPRAPSQFRRICQSFSRLETTSKMTAASNTKPLTTF